MKPLKFDELSLIKPSVLTVGVDASAPLPLHSDPSSEHFEGFEVDLIRSVADRLGVSVDYKVILWSEIFDSLKSSKIDLICTAATITGDRKSIVDFSRAYLKTQLVIVVGQKSEIRKVNDLEGARLAVRVATSAEDFLRANMRTASIQVYHMNTDVYSALAHGDAQAAVDDAPIAKWFVRSNHRLKLAGKIPGTEAEYGMAFKKGNNELRLAIDAALEEIRSDGTYVKLCERWLSQ